jgi:predicted DsbA family dithiol-disulfide isomerase
VKRELKGALEVTWKCFSLEQANSSQGPDFKLWEHPEVSNRSLKAFQAAKCAELQGDELFDSFHLGLFQARHEERKSISDEAVLKEVAQKAGLDVERFLKDLGSDASREWVGKDHTEAVDTYSVFGVPALVFDERWSFFLKMGSLPDSAEEQVRLFKEIEALVTGQPHVLEIKRT